VSFTCVKQLAEAMAAKNAHGEKVSVFDFRQMNRVLELAPDDMTVTVEAGLSLGALQKELAQHRQWLPIDPPNAENVSIHELLSQDLSGPRRFGYGTIREHLIGMRVVLADGRVIKSGGKVVKNVAGYDLARLFIGARDNLGIIVEGTFKVRPMPQLERIVASEVEASDANKVLRAVLDSALTPVIFDMHRLPNAAKLSIVLGLAGTDREVDWQLGTARALGFTQEGTLDYEREFWSAATPVNRLSVLPSRVVEVISELGSVPFVARAGNGIVYFRGAMPPGKSNLPAELMKRVKSTFDPKNIFPEFIS